MRPSRDLCIMACQFSRNRQFWQWANVQSEAAAKSEILTACGVASRNDLDTDPAAAERFHSLIRRPFIDWRDNQQSAD